MEPRGYRDLDVWQRSGWARGYERDSARFFLIARGSLAEISTQADIGGAIGILDLGKSEAWQSECHRLGGRLTRLIDARHRRMSRRT